MKATLVGIVLAVVLLGSATRADAQQKSWNAKVGWLGAITTLTGVFVAIPWSEGENYNVFGDDVCIIDQYKTFDVRDGKCGNVKPAMVKAGVITMAAGVGLMVVGFRQVAVSPQVGPKVVGVRATVRWGGR